jgi:hypothetical protein
MANSDHGPGIAQSKIQSPKSKIDDAVAAGSFGLAGLARWA